MQTFLDAIPMTKEKSIAACTHRTAKPDRSTRRRPSDQVPANTEAKVLIERWRRHYNTIRPHSSLGYRPPASETVLLSASPLAYASPRPGEPLVASDRLLT
jgi:hypothetical protein